MSLKNLNDSELILQTKSLVGDEKKILESILESLTEIERRRLFALRGYGSLFDFCVQELGYSESAAYRRTSSVMLMKSLPEARESLASGSVNLSTLSQLQSFIKKDESLKQTKLNHGEKLSLLKVIENKSQKACEKEFVKLQPELIKTKESIRPVTEELTEIKFMASKELMTKLNELKNILSHQNKSNSTQELIDLIADIALTKVKPEIKNDRKLRQQPEEGVLTPNSAGVDTTPTCNSAAVSQDINRAKETSVKLFGKNRKTRTSVGQIRRQVWIRDTGECQYEDPLTGRKCKMKHKVQIDHIVPRAMGGDDTFENLRLLCFTHNQLAAIQVFSREHMAQFIPGLE